MCLSPEVCAQDIWPKVFMKDFLHQFFIKHPCLCILKQKGNNALLRIQNYYICQRIIIKYVIFNFPIRFQKSSPEFIGWTFRSLPCHTIATKYLFFLAKDFWRIKKNYPTGMAILQIVWSLLPENFWRFCCFLSISVWFVEIWNWKVRWILCWLRNVVSSIWWHWVCIVCKSALLSMMSELSFPNLISFNTNVFPSLNTQLSYV